ncbi:MAG: hypothetical protein AAF610_03410 [Pseudomonadota bacterium]
MSSVSQPQMNHGIPDQPTVTPHALDVPGEPTDMEPAPRDTVFTLPRILRFAGALSVVSAMSLFLLQGWSEGNDVMRYLKLLGQTALLCAGGLALSHGLRETKGARVFFGLALLSIPANFTILGALIYSIAPIDGVTGSYPAFAQWTIGDASAIGLTVVLATAALALVARFCFAVMARASASSLAMGFLLLNAVLLVPLRASTFAAALALVGALAAMVLTRRLTRHDVALSTPEGRFALTALFAPTLIIAVRSLAFYDVSALAITLVLATGFAGLRHLATLPSRGERLVTFLNGLSLPLAALTALAAAASLERVLYGEWLPAAASLVFAALAGDVARRAQPLWLHRLSIGLISTALALGFIGSALLNSALVASAALLFVGLLLLGASALLKRGTPALSGSVMIIAAMLHGGPSVLDALMHANWMALSALGVTAVIAGSILERRGSEWGGLLKQWQQRVATSLAA